MPNNCAEQWEDYSDGVPVEGDSSIRVGLKIIGKQYVIGSPPEAKEDTADLIKRRVGSSCSECLPLED